MYSFDLSFTLAVVLAFMGFLFDFHARFQPSDFMKPTRLYFFDNAKALLMLLVVFGHVIEPLIYKEGYKAIYAFIYLFHMPCFVFISGYFAKRGVTVKEAFSKFIAPLAVFQILYYLLIYSLVPDKIITLRPFLSTPFHALWYLLSLFCWTLLFNFIREKYILHFVAAFTLLSIVAGIFDFIGRELSLSRTIYFFPFFLLGYWVKQRGLNDVFRNNAVNMFIYTILLSLICLGSFFVVIPNGILWANRSYSSVSLDNTGGMITRTITIVSGYLTSLSFLNIMPHNKVFFTDLGSKTLQIYLLHDIFVLAWIHSEIYKYFSNEVLLLFVTLGFSIFICWVSSFDIFGRWLRKISTTSDELIDFVPVPKMQRYFTKIR